MIDQDFEILLKKIICGVGFDIERFKRLEYITKEIQEKIVYKKIESIRKNQVFFERMAYMLYCYYNSCENDTRRVKKAADRDMKFIKGLAKKETDGKFMFNLTWCDILKVE